MPYVDVFGVSTYYEQRGEGPLVMFLHGAAMVVEGWAAQLEGLSHSFMVVAPERRGVGRTVDDDRQWSYEQMAEDTAGFMDALGLTSAHVVGLSDGGNIALILASKRPDLVAKVVVSGANADANGLGEFKEAVEHMSPRVLLEEAPPLVHTWLEIHRQVAVDRGASLESTFAKMQRMWLNYEITDAQLGAISAPALIMSGDRDMIPMEHTIAIWSSITDAQLCVVPGGDHFWMQELPEIANAILTRFFSSNAAGG